MRGISNGMAVVMDSAAEAAERGSAMPSVAEAIAEVDIGETPAETVYAENKLELLHYEPLVERQVDVPVVVVYALINRPYILDLQPDRSVVRRFLEEGFDVYLVDWGEPSALDATLELRDYVDRYIDNCVDVVRERSGVESVNLLGYCMGGTMAAMYATLHPEKVQNLALMAASLHFDGTGGLLERWGGEAVFSPRSVAEGFGTIPSTFFDGGFALMNPIENVVSKYARLADNAEDEEFVHNFARMERWIGDGIDMAGETYRQYIEDVYQGDKFYRNELYLGPKHADIENLTMPVLQILAEYDHLVPPTASRPFNDVIPSEDTEVIEVPTGHIGLSVSKVAHEEYWPAVCDWFASRSSPAGGDLEGIDGIGPAYAERLRAAGIDDRSALAAADAEELSASIDVPATTIADWQDQADSRGDRAP